MKALLDAGTPVDHDRRQDLGLPRHARCCGATLDENLAMIADSVAFLRDAGPRGDLRRRALLRRLEGATPTTPCKTLQAAAAAGARLVVLCDTNGGSMPEEIAELTRDAVAARCRCRSASTATTTATWPWPTRWPPSTPARRRCRARSTASASAAATPT